MKIENSFTSKRMERLSKHFSLHGIFLTVLVGMMFFVISGASDMSGRLVAQELQQQEVFMDDDEKSPPPPPEGAREIILRVFLQGYYINDGDKKLRQARDFIGGEPTPRFNHPKSDNITVRLHDVADYGDVLFTAENVSLLVTGWTVRIQIPDNIEEEVWVSVKHRNHLETVHGTKLDLTEPGGGLQPQVYSIDFTNDGNGGDPSYGENQHHLGGGVYGIYAGDVDQDGEVTIIDRADVVDALTNAIVGYVPEDFDGDGEITIIDRAIVVDALTNARAVVRPASR